MTHSNPSDEPRLEAPATQRSGLGSSLLRVALPVGILALGCVAYAILAVETEEAKSPPVEDQAIRTRVTQLQTRDYPVVVTTHGIVQPHNEVAFSAEVSGRITHISPAFEVGSYFSAGDVLVELDARDYQTAVAVADARRLGAESALQLAKQDYERKLTLFEKNVVSEAEINLAEATRLQAAAELATAAAQVEQAQRDLQRTKIQAPFDGRVRQKVVGLGQSVGIGAPLGVVFAVDFAEVRLPIAGRELQFLELPELVGDAAVDVELRDALSDASATVWRGRIVRTEGALDEDSLELFAIARVEDPFGLRSGNPPLRIGQPVNASIAGKLLTDVVALPRGAVRQLDQVFLVDESELTLTPRTIEPIWSDADFVIVRDPLIREGTLLSTTHLVYAPSGAKVEIIEDTELNSAAAETLATSQADSVDN